MDRYYKKLSMFLVKNKNIVSDDAEVYEYAAKVLFQGIISITTTFFIGGLLGMLKECLYFIFAFLILRKFAGGVHAARYIYCLISSIILVSISLIIIKYALNNHKTVFLYTSIFSTITICTLSPIEHVNKPLSYIEKKVYRIIAIILSITVLLIVGFSMESGLMFPYCIGMALINVSLLMVIAYFKKKISLIHKL